MGTVALDTALRDLGRDQVDQIVCLGDAIQGGPQPAEVVARLRDLGCPVVMGNADAWLLTGEESGEEVISDERRRQFNTIRDWSLTRLSVADLAFMNTFQPTVEIPLEAGRKLLCFHGSPASFDELLMPDISRSSLQGSRWVPGSGDDRWAYPRPVHSPDWRRCQVLLQPGSVGLA
jgi:hypothetical protein